jgi:hypothetical protein
MARLGYQGSSLIPQRTRRLGCEASAFYCVVDVSIRCHKLRHTNPQNLFEILSGVSPSPVSEWEAAELGKLSLEPNSRATGWCYSWYTVRGPTAHRYTVEMKKADRKCRRISFPNFTLYY